VTSAEIAALPWVRQGAAQIVVNQWPDLGISYSLSLAHVATPATQPMLLLFGDMPYVTPGLIAEVVERSGAADICRPVRNGVPGHPVYFSPVARIGIALLRARDSLHEVCHDPALQRIEFECDDDGAFTDIDTPSDLPA
jgi:molybdenum cofactor cytidylyltransferase